MPIKVPYIYFKRKTLQLVIFSLIQFKTTCCYCIADTLCANFSSRAEAVDKKKWWCIFYAVQGGYLGLYMFNLFKSNFCLSSINVIEASRSMISQEKNTNVDYTRNLSKIKFILGFYL